MKRVFMVSIFAVSFFVGGCKPKVSCEVFSHRVVSDKQNVTAGFAEKEDLIHTATEYFLTIRAGDQKSPIEVVFDTGSSNLILPGQDCVGCKKGTRYKPGKSATFTGKGYPISYNSAKADVMEAQDTVGLLCGPRVQTHVGMITQGQNAQGILGAAYGPIMKPAGHNRKTFFDNYFEQTGEEQIFGLLMCGEKSGSKIEVGGRLEEVREKDRKFSWTPVVHNTYYVVAALSAKIANSTNVLGHFPHPDSDGKTNATIVDTGSTFSMLPPDMYQALVSELKRIALKENIALPVDFFGETGGLKAVPVEMAESDLNKFPTLEFELIGGGAKQEALVDKETFLQKGIDKTPITLKIDPEHYFKVVKKGEKHLKRVFSFRSAGTAKLFILGQPLFESNYYVEIVRKDQQGNGLIGFASNAGLCGD